MIGYRDVIELGFRRLLHIRDASIPWSEFRQAQQPSSPSNDDPSPHRRDDGDEEQNGSSDEDVYREGLAVECQWRAQGMARRVAQLDGSLWTSEVHLRRHMCQSLEPGVAWRKRRPEPILVWCSGRWGPFMA